MPPNFVLLARRWCDELERGANADYAHQGLTTDTACTLPERPDHGIHKLVRGAFSWTYIEIITCKTHPKKTKKQGYTIVNSKSLPLRPVLLSTLPGKCCLFSGV